ncbi:MAG: hypothetical protein ABFD54_04725 [Armatimonadota bacterium]
MRALVVVGGLSVVFLMLMLWGSLSNKRELAPYMELVRIHATEQEAIKRFGKPKFVIQNERELRKQFTTWTPIPAIPVRVESKVLVYEPNQGIFGTDVVFVFIDKRGFVTQAVLGVT